MKILSKIIALSFIFIAVFVSCESPYMIKHPVSSGDTYYLYVTFYGDEFEGRQSADGSKFSNSEMTCAARGFPFGTMLEIQSLDTGKKVIAKVSDRPGKNVVDLTQTAFAQIDSPEKGKIKAKIKVVDKNAVQPVADQKSDDNVKQDEVKVEEAPIESGKFYSIQLAMFNDLEDAKKFQESQSVDSYILKVSDSIGSYHIRCGRFASKEEAENYKTSNFSGMDAIVVEVVE